MIWKSRNRSLKIIFEKENIFAKQSWILTFLSTLTDVLIIDQDDYVRDDDDDDNDNDDNEEPLAVSEQLNPVK